MIIVAQILTVIGFICVVLSFLLEVGTNLPTAIAATLTCMAYMYHYYYSYQLPIGESGIFEFFCWLIVAIVNFIGEYY